MNRPGPHATVVLATPARQVGRRVPVAPGATVATVVAASGIATAFPDLDVPGLAVGIFSRRCTPATAVRPGDRVELYRPLADDPNRRRRARGR